MANTRIMEKIHHPRHYNEHPAGIECIDVVEHMSFNIGNAIKYLWRTGLKPNESNEDDLRKAIWYIERQLGQHKDSNFYTTKLQFQENRLWIDPIIEVAKTL